MKKTKILLPLLSVGAIATTAGAITSCSCHKTDFVLTETATFGEMNGLKLEQVNLKKDTTYFIECDFNKIVKSDQDFKDPSSLMVMDSFPSEEVPEPVAYDINYAKVLVDGKELQPVWSYEELGKGKYGVFDQSASDGKRSLVIGGETLNKKSKLLIEIKISDNLNNVCLCFAFFPNE